MKTRELVLYWHVTRDYSIQPNDKLECIVILFIILCVIAITIIDQYK